MATCLFHFHSITMSFGNNLEVSNFAVVRTLQPQELEKKWEEFDRSISFLLRVVGMNKPTKGWVGAYMQVEGLGGKVVTGDDEDWELGGGDEYCEQDPQDIEEKASHPTHSACGPECPVIVDAIEVRKMCTKLSNEDWGRCRKSLLWFFGGFVVICLLKDLLSG